MLLQFWQLQYQGALWKYPFIKFVENLGFALVLIDRAFGKARRDCEEKKYLVPANELEQLWVLP